MTKPVIGLVGGIGAGKSFAGEILAERGGRIINADHIGHRALKDPEIRAAITARWGDDILDEAGEVSRKKLGRVVFADEDQRRKLEEIVFPWIGAEIRRELAEAQADAEMKFVILDAAIMLETGWNNVCDRIVYIHTPRTRRLARLAATRGWDTAELRRRESAQLPLPVKEGRADMSLDNSRDRGHLCKQVDALLTEVLSFLNR